MLLLFLRAVVAAATVAATNTVPGAIDANTAIVATAATAAVAAVVAAVASTAIKLLRCC